LESNETETIDKDKIELKFQSDKWKQPVSVISSRFNNFSEIIQKLCMQVQCEAKKISLFFDGESVCLNKTPVDMDFEGGEILDCRISA
jgi:Ubiquitin-2 like Rad60 SUMO-like